jgi:anti-anti-sigma factor
VTGGSRQVHAESRNGLCVLRISGELDTATASSFTERAGVALRAAPGPVLVDLSSLTFIDADGARALAALLTRTPAGRHAVVLFCPARTRRILDLLGLSPNCFSNDDRPAPASPSRALVEQVRRARNEVSQARLASSRMLATLADTCIRLASTRERTDLTREQGRRTVAGSRAAREQRTRSGQGVTAQDSCA